MFPCTKCGACCRKISSFIKALPEQFSNDPDFLFPYQWDENGVCENLLPDNSCKVYDARPLVCNIEKFINKFSLPADEFYKQNAVVCNTLMDWENLPQELRVKI